MNFKFGIQDYSYSDWEYHWKEIELENYRVGKPVILCFGGNGTVDDKDAIAVAKTVKRLIGSEEEVDILSISYSHADRMTWGYLSTNDEIKIVQNLLMPLVMDKNGERLSFEQAKKNVRRVNFVGHCAGARQFIPEINDLFVRGLVGLGFNYKEILGITEQMPVVGFVGNGKIIEMPCINFKSIYDNLYGREYIQEMLTIDMQRCEIKHDDKFNLEYLREAVESNLGETLEIVERFMRMQDHIILTVDNSINVYTSKLANNLSDHQFENLDRRENWQAQPIMTSRGDRVSQAVAYSIAYSVANSINNEESDEFISLDLTELANHLDDILTSDYARAKKAQENGRNRF